jgi:protein TonB
MPNRRIMAACVALSMLLHLTAVTVASLFRWSPKKPDDVMVVDLADLPRTRDFLPPAPGILRGGPRPLPPPPAPEPLPKARVPDLTPPKMMEGPVPNLPVDPNLPPEEKFSAAKPKVELKTSARGPAAPGKTPDAPVAPRPSGGSTKAPKGSGLSLRDAMTMLEAGRRGQGSGAGEAVGTGGKAKEESGIVEMGGSGATLTAINAPEIQYISYFAGIKRKIELAWGYPPEAAGAGGEVVITFVIGRNGRLDAIELVRGSGHRILDAAALDAIRKASPYDPIPAEYKIPNLQIRAHFSYLVSPSLR